MHLVFDDFEKPEFSRVLTKKEIKEIYNNGKSIMSNKMEKKIVKCTNCGGTGWVKQPVKDIEGNEISLPTLKICPVCKGDGNKEVEDKDDKKKE